MKSGLTTELIRFRRGKPPETVKKEGTKEWMQPQRNEILHDSFTLQSFLYQSTAANITATDSFYQYTYNIYKSHAETLHQKDLVIYRPQRKGQNQNRTSAVFQ